ncbi:unnamed protein product [Gongylonema pulchrum]|uniref:Uncharacterized protein n=1 Tax=Gongylonema pulchrum TaxID=637853 RepID=A0A3P7RJ70_9BILA|nr:unnamed protein product [Gongylonema pulchrum]
MKVDGKTDLCTKNEDINFVLAAFAVEGILRSGNGGGPADVALTLSAENGSVIAETRTVSTANDSTECIERGKVPVTVSTSPVRVQPDLKISGHLLTVTVKSKNLQVAGTSVSLYSNTAVKLPYCDEKSDKEASGSSGMLVCKLKTDSNGIARFPCLPPGSYNIQPSFSTDKLRFSFSPKTKEVTMGSAAEKVLLSFSLSSVGH